MNDLDLAARVAKLERELRRWRIGVLVLLGLGVLRLSVLPASAIDDYLTTGVLRAYKSIATPSLTVENITVTESLRVVDRNGKIRATLEASPFGGEDVSLKLQDESGRKSATIGVGKDSATVMLWTGPDTPLAYIYASTSKWSPAGLDLGRSKEGKHQIELEVTPLGDGTASHLMLRGEDGTDRVYISEASWGGSVATMSPHGSIELGQNMSSFATSEPRLRIAGRHGQAELVFGIDGGEPVARVVDGGGKLAWTALPPAKAGDARRAKQAKKARAVRGPEDNL